MLVNPYLCPVGMEGSPLNDRFRRLQDLGSGRHGELVGMGYKHNNLPAWAAHAGIGGAERRQLAVAWRLAFISSTKRMPW